LAVAFRGGWRFGVGACLPRRSAAEQRCLGLSEFELRNFVGMLRGANQRGPGAADHLFVFEFIERDGTGAPLAGAAGAIEIGFRELEIRRRFVKQRRRSFEPRLGGLYVRFGLEHRAGVEQVGIARLDAGDQRLAGVDFIARIELDPQQLTSQRRRNRVPFPQARLAVLVDRLANLAASHLRQIRLHRRRAQAKDNRPGHRGDEPEQHDATNERFHLH
jgi:hypothetical protein